MRADSFALEALLVGLTAASEVIPEQKAKR
jgi:hypothetical protein